MSSHSQKKESNTSVASKKSDERSSEAGSKKSEEGVKGTDSKKSVKSRDSKPRADKSPSPPPAEASSLPEGWLEKTSRTTGKPYYVNSYTKESMWERPTEPAQPSKEKVQCSHLLVKHAGSRRPTSWREDNIVRSKDEAIEILMNYREQIADGTYTFEELATKFSDCSSAKVGGDLGPFGKGQMQRSFETAAFALAVGEMSKSVETDSGVHLIKRTA